MTCAELAKFLQEIESTTSRNAITEILARLFAQATPTEIGKICYLLQGRVAPLYEAIEFGVAEKFIIRAIAQAYGTSSEDVAKNFKKFGDIGKTAEYLHKGGASALTVSQLFDTLTDVAIAGGEGSQERKISLLAGLLGKLDARSTRYVMRIPLDKLRLGFSEMTMLDALSWMLSKDKSHRKALEEAYNVHTDIGFIAETVKKEGMQGLTRVRARVGSPVLAELCQRLPTADEMIEKMGEVAVEPKYDGVRVQIHYRRLGGSAHASHAKHALIRDGGKTAEVKSFSRNLENTTDMFPELADIGEELHADEAVLDCEAVGIDPGSGRIISFQETTTRKRKHGIDEAVKTVPLKFFVFDILYRDGQDLLETPLSKRRQILERTVKSGTLLTLSPQIITTDPSVLRAYHDEQLKKGLEGVVVKKWNSPYEPGRRGYGWVKFKEEEGKTGKLTDTIDAVIMGYYVGEGKRTDFGIGAFLVGVRRGETFVTVTKIGTGVSDELWKDIRGTLEKIRVNHEPREYADVAKTLVPDVWVEPRVVVEIAGDDLTKSPNHGAGYAIRFPRLVRIRTDKAAHQITSTSEIAHMFSMQGTHKK